jgi:hypothetical protein
VLWTAAAETGRRTHTALEPVLAGGGASETQAVDRTALKWHVIRASIIVLLLADMIFKPGA